MPASVVGGEPESTTPESVAGGDPDEELPLEQAIEMAKRKTNIPLLVFLTALIIEHPLHFGGKPVAASNVARCTTKDRTRKRIGSERGVSYVHDGA
jgi:hypothetical protein